MVDNTCTQRWEYENYQEHARRHRAECHTVEVVVADEAAAHVAAARNQHGVPHDKVMQMWQRWEDDPDALLIPAYTPPVPLSDSELNANPAVASADANVKSGLNGSWYSFTGATQRFSTSSAR